MRKLLLTLLFLTLSFQYSYAKKHALIIAVGDYPRSTGWPTINSVNDVPLIKQALLHQGFLTENIKTLINEEATKKGILLALERLKASLEKGDIVVVHYSGHGQQIFDDNGDEIDDKDEALVPYDAWVRYTHAYKGENHLRDDELANIITSFRNILGKEGQLLILLDSCHSGSATRGGKPRGGQPIFAPQNWKSHKKENETITSGLVENIRLSDNTAPFVVISGASANELNYEYQGYGSLSYAFSKAMSSLRTDFTYRQLFSKIAANMNVISPRQNPTIEGDVDYKLFKGEYVKQQLYFKPYAIVGNNDILKIRGGKLQNIFKGTTVNILPAGTTKVTADKIIATGEIVSSKFNQSSIKLTSALKRTNNEEYWVFIDKKSYGNISLKVFFDKKLNDDVLVKNRITKFLRENNLGSVVQDSLLATVIISKNDTKYTLNTTNNFTEFDTVVSNKKESLNLLTQKLFNYAHGNYLKNLQLNNKKYEFGFRLLPINYDETTETYLDIEEPKKLSNNSIFKVTPKNHVVLEVTNYSKKPIYFSVIEINSKGEINTFLPNDNCDLNDNERLIQTGKTMIFKGCVFSFAPPYEKLMLKGFSSSVPINFTSTIKTRGYSSEDVNSNPLEKFLKNTFVKKRGSGSTKVSDKLDAFSTELIYEIVKE